MRLVRITLLAIVTTLVVASSANAFGGADFTKSRYGVTYLALKALVQVTCPGGTQSTDRIGDFSFCTGTLEITRGGRTIGFTPVALRTNDRITQPVPLQRGVQTFLRRHRSMSVHLRMITHDGQGNFASHERDAVLFDDFHDAL